MSVLGGTLLNAWCDSMLPNARRTVTVLVDHQPSENQTVTI